MNCAEFKELLVAYVEGFLDEQKKRSAAEHLRDCTVCQSELKALTDFRNRLVKNGKVLAQSNLEDGVMSQIVREQNARLKAAREAGIALKLRRIIMKSPVTKLAAAAVIIIAISLFIWFRPQQDSSGGFILLAQACAAEDAIFTGENIVHIKNEIIVYPILKGEVLPHQSGSADFKEQVREDFDEFNTHPDFTWLPMCSLQANGQFRFNQLKLPVYTESYTVIDEAWYDPATRRFARVLKTDGKVVFANSYDGEFIYTSRIASDSTFQLVKEAVGRKFRPPQRPAEFLGLGAGLRSSLREDTPMIQSVEEGKLQDGSPAHIYKAGIPDPHGELKAYWLFKVRDDDGTIAEKEFVISGEPQLLIRRVLTESVEAPEISWSLAEIEGLDTIVEGKPRVSIIPDMVIPNVSVQHMVERAEFETYIFVSDPSWAGQRQITDILDIISPPNRMFAITYRAEDGRHVVLIQSHSYNKMLGRFAQMGQLVYTSPTGFKVWGGGADKWLSKILLSSARASIKDPPADDRIGYVLESPAGTFPALAVNGPISDEELHSLIDSLIPADEYVQP